MLADIMEPKSSQRADSQAQQLETLGLIASGIAHDFNNLLTSIVGQTSLALATLPPENAARPHIEKAIKAAEFAAALTHQLLAYASGSQSHTELIDLNQLISDNVALLSMALLDGVILQLDLGSCLPPLRMKRAQMQQLVMNLIINAAESIQSHPGSVTVRTGKQVLLPGSIGFQFVNGRRLPPGEYIYLQVRDTGIGMGEETLAHIFDPFYTTKPNGRGLGLSAILDIVNSYRGGISVESRVGQGTTFTVLFPRCYDEGKFIPPIH